jgi:hypothetical protein
MHLSYDKKGNLGRRMAKTAFETEYFFFLLTIQPVLRNFCSWRGIVKHSRGIFLSGKSWIAFQ